MTARNCWTGPRRKLREYLTVSETQILYTVLRASGQHIPGFGSRTGEGLDSGFLFLAPLSLALCLFINYTTFTPDEEGVYFNDRIYQMPLKRISGTRKKRIPARNGIVVASTGGGKSVLTLNIVQQLSSRAISWWWWSSGTLSDSSAALS